MSHGLISPNLTLDHLSGENASVPPDGYALSCQNKQLHNREVYSNFVCWATGVFLLYRTDIK